MPTSFLFSFHCLSLVGALSFSIRHTRSFSHSLFSHFPITFSLLLRLSGLRVRKPGSPLTNSLGASEAEAKALLQLQIGKTEWKRSFWVTCSASRLRQQQPQIGSPANFPMTNDDGISRDVWLLFSLLLALFTPHPPLHASAIFPPCTSRRSPPSPEQKFIFS